MKQTAISQLKARNAAAGDVTEFAGSKFQQFATWGKAADFIEEMIKAGVK